jgi:chromosome segregation ATPase
MRLSFLLLSLGVLATTSALAQTRSYCCVDGDGHQQCGNVLPTACYGKAYRELDARGRTIKRYDAALTPEQRAQKEKELALKKELERQAQEESRRNRALLNTYASEKDIDAALEKALVELEKSVKAAQDKLAEATKRKDKLMGEAEFYKKKGIPPELKRQIQDNESEIKAKEKELQAREQEREDIRKRFEEEKQRYRDLTKGKARTLPPGMAGNP